MQLLNAGKFVKEIKINHKNTAESDSPSLLEDFSNSFSPCHMTEVGRTQANTAQLGFSSHRPVRALQEHLLTKQEPSWHRRRLTLSTIIISF